MIFDDEYELLLAAFQHLPLFFVCFAGLIFALATWRRHPAASALAFAGTTVFLAAAALYVVWEYYLLPSGFIDAFPEDFDLLVFWGAPVLQACGLALVLTAVFVGRAAPAHRRPLDDA
jgi:hypothetical protein